MEIHWQLGIYNHNVSFKFNFIACVDTTADINADDDCVDVHDADDNNDDDCVQHKTHVNVFVGV